jgi:hypothetical protein
METQPVPQQQPLPVAPPAPTFNAELPNIPDSWPGAWGIYKFSKQAVKRNWMVLLTLIVADILVAVVFSLIIGKVYGRGLAYLVDFFFEIALISALFASIRGQKISFSESLRTVKPMLYLNYILTGIITGIIGGLSFVLLIIPFFFVFPRLMFAPYFLIDKNMDPLDAIRASWDATKGNVGKIWGIIGVTFALGILAITIIGIPFAIYFDFMYSAAFVILYEYVHHLNPMAPAPQKTNPLPPQAPMPPVNPQPPIPPAPTQPRPLVQ